MPVMPFSLLSLRVDPSDLDSHGYVNSIAIVKYFQAARIQYWEKAGINSYSQNSEVGPILVSCRMDAKVSLFYPGQVYIRSHVKRIGTCSFSMTHELSNASGAMAAAAEEVLVMFDYKKKEKVCFPPHLRTRIAELEEAAF